MNIPATASFLIASLCLSGFVLNLIAGIGYLNPPVQNNPTYKSDTIEYVEKYRLNEQCWVRALDRLNLIRQDKEVTSAAMILGNQNGGGHAWIEYTRGNEVINYDPTIDRILKVEKVKD